jgi:dephospho-CoA kinase
MIIVGITGGIGTGKSVVTTILSTMGYPVYDSDSEAKNIMLREPQVIRELQQAFGDDLFDNGQLNRQRLAGEVFSNANRLQQLNNIVHPAVKNHFRRWVQTQSGSPIVFLESAILFESGFDNETGKIVLITTPEEIRIQRVMERDQCTREQIRQRIAQQWPEERKVKLTDFIIVNDGKQPLLRQTEQMISELQYTKE